MHCLLHREVVVDPGVNGARHRERDARNAHHLHVEGAVRPGSRELRLRRELEHSLLEPLQQQLVHDTLHFAVPLPSPRPSTLHWVCVELWAPPLTETFRRGVSKQFSGSTFPKELQPSFVMVVDHTGRVHLILNR